MNELNDLGKDLVEYAEHEAVFTAQRGLIDELFPFIYVASTRMSLRAISRWLAETKRVKISANALSKAMREQETYWAQIVEDVAPAARRFAGAHSAHPWQVLDHWDYFKHLEAGMPGVVADDGENVEKELRKIANAAKVLRNRWFALPEEARDQCRRHFVGEFNPVEEEDKEGEIDGSKKKTE